VFFVRVLKSGIRESCTGHQSREYVTPSRRPVWGSISISIVRRGRSFLFGVVVRSFLVCDECGECDGRTNEWTTERPREGKGKRNEKTRDGLDGGMLCHLVQADR
jgi:hypothetical protein